MSAVATSLHEAGEVGEPVPHLGNQIVQLREWGTERAYPLPAHALRCRLGPEEDCAVRLSDPDVLPVHAHLTRERQRWLVRTLGDTPGLWRDGARSSAFVLEPGAELGVGGTTLVAESAPWIALRSFCARILGWGSERLLVVDRALRSIRLTMTRRAPLVLRGEGDLAPIAHALHRRMLSEGRPFVVCDPRRRNGKASVRSAASCTTGAATVQAAAGGTVCLRLRRPPQDFTAVLARVRDPDAGVQLIVCANQHEEMPLVAPIEVPPLSERAADLPRIVDEYALDAIAALSAPPTGFHDADRDWVLAHAATSLSEIEKATLRLVALRTSGNLRRAALRLGMAPVSLSRWLSRHKLASDSAVAR